MRSRSSAPRPRAGASAPTALTAAAALISAQAPARSASTGDAATAPAVPRASPARPGDDAHEDAPIHCLDHRLLRRSNQEVARISSVAAQPARLAAASALMSAMMRVSSKSLGV